MMHISMFASSSFFFFISFTFSFSFFLGINIFLVALMKIIYHSLSSSYWAFQGISSQKKLG